MDKIIDYIFKNKNEKKCVGEISNLTITPFFTFEITTGNKAISCYLDHLLSEWHIRIDNYEIDVELAHPTDIFWNTNAIFEKTEDEELSLQIAYAINEVYKKRNYSEDLL